MYRTQLIITGVCVCVCVVWCGMCERYVVSVCSCVSLTPTLPFNPYTLLIRTPPFPEKDITNKLRAISLLEKQSSEVIVQRCSSRLGIW